MGHSNANGRAEDEKPKTAPLNPKGAAPNIVPLRSRVCHPPHPPNKGAGLAGVPVGSQRGRRCFCLYAIDYPGELAGLICEDFAFQVPAPDFALAVLKGLSHIAPHAHVVRLKNEDFSRDPEVVRAMNEDPLIAHETQPTQTMAAIVRADERLKNEFPGITLPVLIIHGTGDKAAKVSGSNRFFDEAGSVDKTLKLYEGSYHDPLNDLDRQTVIADIRDWLSTRIPAASSARA